MTSGSASLDIFELFGDTIESFRTRQNTVVELIWDSQIENKDFEEGEAINVNVLSRWLAPLDRVIAALQRDHSTYVDQQVEVSLSLPFISNTFLISYPCSLLAYGSRPALADSSRTQKTS
jgi:hypothetical protein